MEIKVDLSLKDLEPYGGLYVKPDTLPDVKFSKKHPIETARQYLSHDSLDLAKKSLDSYTPPKEEFAIYHSLRMIIFLKEGKTKKALFHANKLLFDDFTSVHRLTNLLEIAVAADQLFFAEYWSNNSENVMYNDLRYMKNAIIINLKLGNISKAIELSEDCLQYSKNQQLNQNEREVAKKLSDIVSKNQVIKADSSWKQNRSNILISSSNKKILPVFTLPKSGTHYIRNIASHLSEVDWHIVHVYQHKPLHFIKNKRVLTLRDPRSMILSLKNYVDKTVIEYENLGYVNSPAFDFLKFDEWSDLSENEKLIQIIEANDGDSALFNKFYRLSLLESSLIKDSDLTHICKFEDLCATEENKISNKQTQTLLDLLCFFEISVDDERVLQILEKSWGNSATFHKANPDAWKSALSKNIISKIEQKYGYFINDWGYS